MSDPKKTSPEDWHPADIHAALRKAGWSLAQLALHHGYASNSALCNAIARPFPKGERIIAAAIGVKHPMVIWPSRYDSAGQPNRRRSKLLRPKNPPRPSIADMALPRNVQKRAA